MFYCEPCREKREWPESIMRSEGPCECCGETAVCYDMPSRLLPIPKKTEVVFHPGDHVEILTPATGTVLLVDSGGDVWVTLDNTQEKWVCKPDKVQKIN